MLVTGVTAYGINSANDDSGDSGFFNHGDHQKVNHSKDKKSHSKSSDKSKSSDNGKSPEITLDITMQQNVNNFLFNIPTAFILNVDEYDSATFTHNYVYLPDGDEYDWEVDLQVIEFDQANGRDLTQEDVESYAEGDYSETTINGITGYYSQDGDWETFVFGSGNEIFILDVYGISLDIVLNDFTQEPLVGDTEVQEDTSEDETLDEETVDDSSDDSSYDDSSYDDSYYDDSSYDDSSYDDSSYDDSSYDDSSYDDSYYDDSSYDDSSNSDYEEYY